jgi:hypothetical protein
MMADLENGLFQSNTAERQCRDVISAGSAAVDNGDGTWIIRRGLANNACALDA